MNAHSWVLFTQSDASYTPNTYEKRYRVDLNFIC